MELSGQPGHDMLVPIETSAPRHRPMEQGGPPNPYKRDATTKTTTSTSTKSLDLKDGTIKFVSGVTNLCRDGGFNLTSSYQTQCPF